MIFRRGLFFIGFVHGDVSNEQADICERIYEGGYYAYLKRFNLFPELTLINILLPKQRYSLFS